MEVYAELFARIDAAELRTRSNEMVEERLHDVDASLMQAMAAMRQLQTQNVSIKQETNVQRHVPPGTESSDLLSSIVALQRRLHMAMTILAVPLAETPDLPAHVGEVEMKRAIAPPSEILEQAETGRSDGATRARAVSTSASASETETEDEEEFDFPDQADSNQHGHRSSTQQPIDMNDPDSVYKVLRENVDTCAALGAQLAAPKTKRKRITMKQMVTVLLRTLNVLRSIDASLRDGAVSHTLLSELQAALLDAVSSLDRSGKPAKSAGVAFQLLAEVIRVCNTCPRFESELSRAREALAYLVENGEAPIDPNNNAHRKWRMLPEQCLSVAEQVSDLPLSLTRTNRVVELLAVIHKMFAIIIREHKVSDKHFRPRAKAQFKRAVALAVQCIVDNPVPSKKNGPRVKFLEKLTLAANSNKKLYAVLKE